MNGTTLSNNLLIGHKEQPIRSGKPPLFGKRGARRLIIIGGATLCLALVAGIAPRLLQRREATIDTKQLALPNVTVVSPSIGAAADGLILPAEVKPWQEA